VELDITQANGQGLKCRTARIAVADPETDPQLRRLLMRLGHEIVAVAADGTRLLTQCLAARPDLAIASTSLSGAGGLEAAERLYQEGLIPSILITPTDEILPLPPTSAEAVLAVLARPIRVGALAAAISLGLWRFERLQALTREAAGLRQALEDRKLIERAKGVLVQRLRVNEQLAYDQMRKLASRQNLKLVDVGRSILAAEQTFAALDPD
jgi:response regulator NasT